MFIALNAVLATPQVLQISVPGQTCHSAPSKAVLARIKRKVLCVIRLTLVD